MNEVKIKLLTEGARLPERQTDGAAGYDIYALQDVEIRNGRNIVKTGFAIELPRGMFATIKARSGFSVKGMEDKRGMRFDADVLLGTIDDDFRGEVGVIIKSYEHVPFVIAKGTRIAQMIFQHYEAPSLKVADELSDTERADGGYGHTGTK